MNSLYRLGKHTACGTIASHDLADSLKDSKNVMVKWFISRKLVIIWDKEAK